MSLPMLLRRRLGSKYKPSKSIFGAVRRDFSVSNQEVSQEHNPLKDTFGRFHNYLRISLTEKCNFRCVYCMPLDGVDLTPADQILSTEETKRLITVFTSHGVNKIRFTGGEPTLNKDLAELIRHSRSIPTVKSVGITSNGLVLKSQLDKLCEAGLTHVNISLDTLIPSKFATIVRRPEKSFSRVMAGVYAAVAKGLHVKINCVVMRGVNDQEVAAFAELAKEVQLDVRFIELMPFDSNNWDATKLVPYFEILDILKSQGYDVRKDASHKRDPSDTTKWYRAYREDSDSDGEEEGRGGFRGRLGFITSMTSNFCAGCNRLRITADGKIKVCLFGNDELNLLEALRKGLSDQEISDMIGSAVREKKKALGGHASPAAIAVSENRPMILIGG